MDPTALPETINPARRQLLGVAALATAAATVPIATARAATRSLPPLKRVDAGALRVEYAEWGPPDGTPVLLLHGWPYDIHSFAEAGSALGARGYRAIAPHVRGFGGTRFRLAETPRNAQQAALATDAIDFLDALGLERVHVAGFDWGARTANILAAIWPERCRSMVSVSGYLIGSREANRRPLPPEAERQWWYQYYFATDRGRDGYAADIRAFNRLIWSLASPKWDFDERTFELSAAAFDNPDHVAIVIHNYRWRLGLADGERRFDALEARLAAGPPITVPTLTLEGDANGAPHPEPAAYVSKFKGPHEHRLLAGGVGHNPPQERPEAFVQAIVDAEALARGARS